MNGVHDMGGLQDMGSVRYEKDEPVFHAAWGRTYIRDQRVASGHGRLEPWLRRHAQGTLAALNMTGEVVYSDRGADDEVFGFPCSRPLR